MGFFNKKKNIRKKTNPHMTMMVIPHGNGKNIKSFRIPIALIKFGVFACLVCALTIGYFIKGYFDLQYIVAENEELRQVNADQSVKLEELTAFTGNMREQLNSLIETDQEIRAKVGLTKSSEKEKAETVNVAKIASTCSFDKYVYMNLSVANMQPKTVNSPVILKSPVIPYESSVIPYKSPVIPNSKPERSSIENNLAFSFSNNLAFSEGIISEATNMKSVITPSRGQSNYYFSSRMEPEDATVGVIEQSESDTTKIDTLEDLKEELLKMDNQLNKQAKNMDQLKADVEKQLAYQNALPSYKPVQGRITSNFGWRHNPFTKSGSEFHDGLDFGVAYGSPIRAAGDGVVTYSGYKSGWGNVVIISHGYGYVSQYAHNSSNLVKVGTKVKRGQIIARVGSTGRSTGAHLHFGVAKNGKWIDPKTVLK